jgi:hypothetical protein
MTSGASSRKTKLSRYSISQRRVILHPQGTRLQSWNPNRIRDTTAISFYGSGSWSPSPIRKEALGSSSFGLHIHSSRQKCISKFINAELCVWTMMSPLRPRGLLPKRGLCSFSYALKTQQTSRLQSGFIPVNKRVGLVLKPHLWS